MGNERAEQRRSQLPWRGWGTAIAILTLGILLIWTSDFILSPPTGSTVTAQYQRWRHQQLWGGFGILALGIAALTMVRSDIKGQPTDPVYLLPVDHSSIKYGDLSPENAIDRLRMEGDTEFQVEPPSAKFTLELAAAIAGTSLFLALLQWFSLWISSPTNSMWWIILGPIALLVWLFAWVFWRSTLMQMWTNHHYRAKREGPFFCAACSHPLAPLPSEQLDQYLSSKERKLAEIQSVRWVGYYCAQCYPALDNPDFTEALTPATSTTVQPEDGETTLRRPFHLFALDQSRLEFTVCPKCDAKALKKTIKILKQATEDEVGKMESQFDCKMCDHHDVTHHTIPKKPKSAD